jgi:hypothetical protein
MEGRKKYMIKLICGQPKWLAGLVLLVAAILVIGGCIRANQPPVISSLTVNVGWVSPSDSCQVKCVASDPDGDELSYTWSANGDISGGGSIVTWTAPATPGDYTIMVKVTDGRGGEATMQLPISVAFNHPPVIVSLTAERQRVRRAETCAIECTASDPDGDKLSYRWSATGGNITGEGGAVTWVAPNAFGKYTITVTVTDGKGDEAFESIDITVTCCG